MEKQKIKLYETMETGENLSWCRPYISRDGSCAMVINEGEIINIMINGKDFPNPSYEQIASLASRLSPDDVNPDADDNELVEILCDIMREVGCADCPYCDECECMDELPS